MRVTSNTFSENLTIQLGDIAARMARLQMQASTGQRLVMLEDDPAGMARVLDLQNEASALSQYQRNIDRQMQMAQASFSVMQSLKKISDRASEIATLADGLKSPEELKIYATEITQLIRQGVQLLNTTSDGRYLFGGTATDIAPFTLTEGPDKQISTVDYQGNTTLPEVEVAEGVTLSSQTLGANNSGAGARGLVSDSRVGVDFFAHLISLQDHLLAGDTAAIAGADRSDLKKDEENLLFHIAGNGTIQSRLNLSSAMARDRASFLEQRVSGEADADLAQTLTRLSQTQTAYQAALQTGASVLDLSLLDYLR